MASPVNEHPGPDLTQGVTLADFAGKAMLRGHTGKKAVLLRRMGDEMLAVGAKCTHPQNPLDQGLVMGETLRCPLHHACFSLRTGKAPWGPVVDPVPCWKIGHQRERIMCERLAAPAAQSAALQPGQPGGIVIIGDGAAGFAQAAGRTTGGILADAQPGTPQPGIFAAGNAERGPVGATMPGAGRPFQDMPFFQSAHCATTIRHCGHAGAPDEVAIDGGIAAYKASVRHREEGGTLAAATIDRDIAVLGRGQPLAGLAR